MKKNLYISLTSDDLRKFVGDSVIDFWQSQINPGTLQELIWDYVRGEVDSAEFWNSVPSDKQDVADGNYKALNNIDIALKAQKMDYDLKWTYDSYGCPVVRWCFKVGVADMDDNGNRLASGFPDADYTVQDADTTLD